MSELEKCPICRGEMQAIPKYLGGWAYMCDNEKCEAENQEIGVTLLHALNTRKPEPGQPAAVPDIKTMVDRFLGWKLPDDFAPDGGISFKQPVYGNIRTQPTGTNLLTADQAKAMFEFVLAASPKQQGGAG